MKFYLILQHSFFPKSVKTIKIMMFSMLIASIAAINFFESIRRIPLSITYIIMNLKGIFVIIMTVLFLDDKVTLKVIICISISFFGTMMLIKPSILFNVSGPEANQSQTSSAPAVSDYVYFLGCCFALICCLTKVGVSIWIRKFSKFTFRDFRV